CVDALPFPGPPARLPRTFLSRPAGGALVVLSRRPGRGRGRGRAQTWEDPLMADTTNVHAEDVFPVRSRVSWGAIFAGVFVALAISVLLNLLGAAIHLSVYDWINADPSQVNNTLWGVGIWAVVASLIALFVGGW